MSWSLTRQDHGEYTFWAGIALAAALGQIGLPGGGIGFGYSATNTVGLERATLHYQALPQGRNPVQTFIPVARISDLLLNPGGNYQYNGATYTYPDVRLVYWAGGNPFHHHQDLNRMRRAWQKPETIVVHEWCWNALAKHADIVLPCTTTLEREDLALSPRDPYIIRMSQVIEPVGEARSDFEILCGLARKMGVEQSFTAGRNAAQWQHWLYEHSRQTAAAAGVELPPFDALEHEGWFRVAAPAEPHVMLGDFRADPNSYPLDTPSGKIEIYSETIARFGYADCPPHPAWLEPFEWLGGNDQRYPLHLISNQPTTKLHSHLDHGPHSRAAKIKGREPVTMHPDDAASRQVAAGDLVRVFNDRGACLCAAVLSGAVRPGVIQISTGAWLDLDGETGLCKHGNPNVLTRDRGTSRLAQGPTAHTCLVEVERYDAAAPAVTAYDPPCIE